MPRPILDLNKTPRNSITKAFLKNMYIYLHNWMGATAEEVIEAIKILKQYRVDKSVEKYSQALEQIITDTRKGIDPNISFIEKEVFNNAALERMRRLKKTGMLNVHQVKICIICGVEFETNIHIKKCCSIKCKNHKGQNDKKSARKGEILIC